MTDAWDGRPENPERDGWHWLAHREGSPEPFEWAPGFSEWWLGGNEDYGGGWKDPDYVRRNYRYLGPCLTPDEVAARAAAAAEAMREACLEACRPHLKNTAMLLSNPPQSSGVWDAMNAIRARGKETNNG